MTSTTVDLSKYDRLHGYDRLPRISHADGLHYFPTTESISACVTERMRTSGMDVPTLARRAGVGERSAAMLARTGRTGIQDTLRLFRALGIRTETLPREYAEGRG